MRQPHPSRHATVIDVTALQPGTCRHTIESTFAGLRTGEALEVVAAHDPAPLRAHFAMERPGQSEWTCLEKGPTRWRVRLVRIA